MDVPDPDVRSLPERVVTVVGNRPQLIKAAALHKSFVTSLIDTGQHYDPNMSGNFYTELGLPAPRRLDLRTSDVERMRNQLRRHLRGARWAVVFGDTNTTLAATLAATDEGVPVAHVEAGERSYDLGMPEERNRIRVDPLASLHLCVTEKAARRVNGLVVGDLMADAVRLFPVVPKRSGHVVATIHREANVQPGRLERIRVALEQIPDLVFVAHPRTSIPGIEAVGYKEMAALVAGARCVVTDSGGLQKEAYWRGTPCVTVRPSTEWTETVDAGANELVEPEDIPAAVKRARMPAVRPLLYGDGYAAERIVAALTESKERIA